MCNIHIIRKEDYLLRRFPISESRSDFYKVINGKKIPSSFAFKTKRGENGLSVNIKVLTQDLQDFMIDPSSYSAVEFLAEIPLSSGHDCVHDPFPAEESKNGAHALILGDTGKLAKKLSKNCAVIENV